MAKQQVIQQPRSFMARVLLRASLIITLCYGVAFSVDHYLLQSLSASLSQKVIDANYTAHNFAVDIAKSVSAKVWRD